ncbi:hydrogenase maturation nickel metallochaperone HypA [Candidatus Obscuribacterales bacterium]|jgi:Zn finger protein HypA/HybF involved in hydrogenase expression|nr:hydrogenase maturation nickel metallochaperone HypA [Candidatus Obscuribacterales bacterium]
MHEATVAFAILNKAAEALSNRFAAELASMGNSVDVKAEGNEGHPHTSGKPRVVSIKVEIGEFRNIDPESLTFAFDSLRKDSPELKDASLKINLVEARAICAQKHEYHPLPDSYFACTICGGSLETMLRGEELNITGIELQHANDNVEGR